MSARRQSGRDPMASMPLHTADWLSSATVALLGSAGEATYLRLLLHQWLSEGDGLPVESDALRALTRATAKEWAAAWPLLERKFPIDADGRRRSPRLHQEWTYCRDRRDVRRTAGQLGGAASVKAMGKQPSSKTKANVKQTESPIPIPLQNSSSTPVQQLGDSPAVLQRSRDETAGMLPIGELADRAMTRVRAAAS